ncbi:MAG: hypothetical protein AAF928_07350 [Myxococcota bacterium]
MKSIAPAHCCFAALACRVLGRLALGCLALGCGSTTETGDERTDLEPSACFIDGDIYDEEGDVIVTGDDCIDGLLVAIDLDRVSLRSAADACAGVTMALAQEGAGGGPTTAEGGDDDEDVAERAQRTCTAARAQVEAAGHFATEPPPRTTCDAIDATYDALEGACETLLMSATPTGAACVSASSACATEVQGLIPAHSEAIRVALETCAAWDPQRCEG